MALDELRDDDEVMKSDGITYLVNKQLFDQAKPITVDFVQSAMGEGFSISSNMKLGGGSACGSSSCSC